MNRRWNLIEQVLRGAFLGLGVVGALHVTTGRGLALLLASAAGPMAIIVMLELWKRRHRSGLFPAGLILALIDQPTALHWAPVLGGLVGLMGVGVAWWIALLGVVIGGLLGWCVGLLYRVRSPVARRMGMILFLVVVAGVLFVAIPPDRSPLTSLGPPAGMVLLSWAFLYYLLVFAGRSEEAEFDIGIVSLLIGLGLALVIVSKTGRGVVVLGPVALYAVYCERARRHMVVFKHLVRGIDHEQNKRWREALVEYRLAQEADPASRAAREGSWHVHQQIDVADIESQPDVLSLIDPAACLERTREILRHEELSSSQSTQATHLLALVDRVEPRLHWETRRDRCRLLLKQGAVESILETARPIVSLTTDELALLSTSQREAVLDLWTMLLEDPLLVGPSSSWLDGEGLLSFLSALELTRTSGKNDSNREAYRPFLYRRLTLREYRRARQRAGQRPYPLLDRASLTEAARGWAGESAAERAAELWEILAEEYPDEAIHFWYEAASIAGPDQSQLLRERIFEQGVARGPATLAPREREAFDLTTKKLALAAEQLGNVDEAIRRWEIFAASPASGWQTRAKLFHLYRDRGAHLPSIRQVEAILLYDLSPDVRGQWIDARNDLYDKISPEELCTQLAPTDRYFHFRYCARRAMQLLDQQAPEERVNHYLSLAELGPPSELRLVNYVLGHRHLRAGRPEEAAQCLEAVCQSPLGSSADEEERGIYHRSCRLLGEICVERLDQPARGLPWLLQYKDHVESGADTLFLLGKAYEKLGQIPQARKWYDMVTVYPSHPRTAEAKEALSRLSSS